MHIPELLNVKSHMSYVYDKFDKTTFKQYIGTGTGKDHRGCWDETHRWHSCITRILSLLIMKSCGEFFTTWLIC